MVPSLTAVGRSFKGAAAYYLHDKRLTGGPDRDTAERVAWTETLNLPTDDTDRAWRMMAHTALSHDELKSAAGIKRTGRKLENPVLAYSLSWHPDERPTQEQQLEAARETLRALKLEHHQAIIVAHNDEPHAHVHVLVNRIDPDTGLAAGLRFSKLKLSRWAQTYEQRHGRIFCTERVINNSIREGLTQGAAKPSRRKSRREWEVANANPRSQAAAATLAEQKRRFGEQAATEREAVRRKSADSTKFAKDRRTDRQAIRDRYQAEGAAARDPRQARAQARMADTLIKATPELAMAELTRSRSTFTRQDMARLVGRHTKTNDQFKAVLAKLESSAELIRIGRDARGRERFTTKGHQEIEQRMERHARLMHAVQDPRGPVAAKWAGKRLSPDQDAALRHVLAPSHLAAIVGYAGSGKSTMLDAARQSWEAAGFTVKGAALSGIAADGLKNGAGIDSRTIHSRLHQWEQGQNKLTAKDVLVIDEAGMVGSRQMERLLHHANEAKAKIVLVGDPQQLQAIDAGAAFKAIIDRVGAAELTTVRRQKAEWQQDATRALASGQTGEALKRYEFAGMVHKHARDDDARTAVIDAWHKSRVERPGQSQIMLAYTRADVRSLNDLARQKLRDDGTLGRDFEFKTEAGKRSFALNDRVYFLKNDNGLGVKNGTLGTVERVAGGVLTVRIDGEAGKRAVVNTKDYAHLDHGYAATIHKSQGVTVDRAHLLATRNLDMHAAYVGMTRHRERLDMHWSLETFPTRERLERVLSREGGKDTTLEYKTAAEELEQARQEAVADLKLRLDTRARTFREREQTPAGRVANAKALAGKQAGPVEVAKLALNSRKRGLLFQHRQRAVVQRARQAEVKHQATPAARPTLAGVRTKRKAALFANDRQALNQAGMLKAKHQGVAGRQAHERKVMTAEASKQWLDSLKQATIEAGVDRALDQAQQPDAAALRQAQLEAGMRRALGRDQEQGSSQGQEQGRGRSIAEDDAYRRATTPPGTPWKPR